MRGALRIMVAHVMTLGAILMRRPQREQGVARPLADYSSDRLHDSEIGEGFRNLKIFWTSYKLSSPSSLANPAGNGPQLLGVQQRRQRRSSDMGLGALRRYASYFECLEPIGRPRAPV